MQVLFEDRNGQLRVIGNAENMQDFHVVVNTFCDDHNYHIHYKRMWISSQDSSEPAIIMDVGSHTEFFRLFGPREILEQMLVRE